MGLFNGVFAGAYAAWCASYVAVGLYFLGAYLARRRDDDYLVFSLITLSLAVHSAGLGLHYADPSPARWVVPHVMANAGALGASTFGVHFALLVADVQGRARFLRPLYALAFFLLVALLVARPFFDLSLAAPTVMRFMGEDVTVVRAPVRALGVVYLAFAVGNTLATTGLLGWAVRAGKREVAGAFVGAVLLTGAVAVDVTGTLRAARWVHVTPHVYVLFALGVAGTMLGRYRRLSLALTERSAELERRTDELVASCEELSIVRDELVRKKQLAALGEMAAVVAHEVRNPLAVLQNAISGLQKPTLTDADRVTLHMILGEEVQRLDGVVRGLLSYVRPIDPEMEDVDVRVLVERAASAADGTAVEVVIGPEVNGTFVADPALLRRAVDNLVENALQAMEPGGRLTVALARRVGPREREAHLTIEDTGGGMNGEVVARATTPFFTTRASGTGLGLAIVDRIMEAHGGRVEIASEPERGTRVTLVLPERPGSSPRL